MIEPCRGHIEAIRYLTNREEASSKLRRHHCLLLREAGRTEERERESKRANKQTGKTEVEKDAHKHK